ncbi:response regulator [Sphingomonas bacterium]|uniref:response regulator n=1 Tax=Sphingomonas bacterium TaxID=1895847 RepID=UPI001576F7C1|nr:response regulator [Sphingomonas bacterium]
MCHVLIIEDEPLVAMMIEDVLLQAGATSATIATTQAEAIAAANACRPEFISSDVMLLEGTGPAAVAAIRSVHGAIPTLFITATPAACEPCRAPDRILVKPFSARHVASAFEALAGPRCR